MIGLDTNVLVRYVTRDDAEQAALADTVMDGLSATAPGVVTQVVLCELWWVLGSAYRSPATERAELIATLLTTQGIVVEGADAVRAALLRTAEGADFADALVAQVCRDLGCGSTITFDKRAAAAAGMTLLEANNP